MTQLKKDHIQNQRAIYERLRATGRNDTVAQIVLQRMAKEIQTLEGAPNETQENASHVDTSGLARRFITACNRFKNKLYANYHQLSPIPQKQELSLTEARGFK